MTRALLTRALLTRALLHGALLGAALLTNTRIASAERVALIRPPAEDALLTDTFNRLQAELRLHAFESDVVEAQTALSEATPIDRLREIAKQTGAIAAIALLHQGATTYVDIWLVDRASGKTSVRRIQVGSTKDAASILAFRAVDLLRASLQEYEPGERPPKDVVGSDHPPLSKAVRRWLAPPAPRLRLRAEGVGVYAGQALGTAWGPALGVHLVSNAFEFGLMFAGPLLGGRFSAAAGSAATRQELAWLDARFTFYRSGKFASSLSGGLGAHFLHAAGQANPPLISNSGSTFGFLSALGLGGEFAVSRAAALGLTVRSFVLAPRQGVALLEERVKVAQPLLQASAFVVVGL